ncbi:unnamed protein product [Rhizophagus irregularis]|uniref:Uncharacterized protein n=1 Tax=Rhizophagus irregularis TaxID=588596 RepID=A0A2I1H507_9GLOM|nr:hypothetical protein RhiirA4_547942 [Rhizophagus irregularis]CAB4420416.1 unnamed protein product [Rhizophagus irregularis]
MKLLKREKENHFRFSYGISGFYVGIYDPCGSAKCNFPSTFVMNENRKRCPHHVREISHVEDPIMHITFNSHEKNKRLGMAYTKDFEAKEASIVKKKLQLQMEKVDNLSTEVARFNSRLELMERIEHLPLDNQ